MRAILGLAAGLLAGAAMTLSPAQAEESVTLTWQMWTGSDADTAVWQHLADMVHAKNPAITVTL